MVDPVQLLAGITEVKAVPFLGSSSIVPRLKSSIEGSVRVRAAVAYLTISENFISNQLISKLASQYSFLCVDFHLPTNVSALCAMRKSGANVYLHLTRLAPRALPSTIGMPPHLLHTKMLLFDMPDHASELWVGSHNWTPRALEGVNVEYSLIVSVRQDSHIYTEAEQYLENIRRNLCQIVNPALETYYLMLQGQDESPAVTMELEGEGASTLENQRITIFGTDPDELVQVNRVGRALYVVVTDSLTSRQFVYESNILQTGLLTASDAAAGGISFSERRYAFRLGKTYPRIETAGVPPTTTIDAAHYFITLFLYLKASIQLLEPAKKNLWETSSNSSFTERLDERAKLLFGKRQPHFQVPSAGLRDMELPTLSSPQLLEEKRLSKQFPLLTKRIARPIDRSQSEED